MARALDTLFKKLYGHFGPQHWWPARTPFEVMVGAILTQNTSWRNVEKAINNLREKRLLRPQRLLRMPEKKLASLIKPAGYYNIKTRRLKCFLEYLFSRYQGNPALMRGRDTALLRKELLCVNGIGKETADSILLYGLGKPVFVVDAYTKRILVRRGIIDADADYEKIQNLFMKNLKPNVQLFNEYHALLVKLGKDFCLKTKPKCAACFLRKKRRIVCVL